ncbi:uncharacterized protein [Rutidosis leptorrhynchoides]|uniref:uncharacterized protein n=1 Tax=Rutidosis leptorrhynchoides TaxID=125765 RepID=UPI003A999632
MDSGQSTNVEGDRLSNFIYNILSFIDIQEVIGLSVLSSRWSQLLIPASKWELLGLTTLYLDYVTLYDDDDDDDIDHKGIGLFSKCTNLQNLTLKHCEVKGLDGFYICHPMISNLTLENGLQNGDGKVINIVAPKLVNLIIRDCGRKHLISAPELAFFLFKGYNPLDVSADGFRCLETMHLCIENLNRGDVLKIVSFLQQLNTVKFLTVNLELVKFLSSHSKLISQQPCPFANLRSLKIYPENLEVDRKVSMSTEVKNYFLSRSTSAAFTLISREEARGVSMDRCLREFIVKSRVLLEKDKLDTQRNISRIGQIDCIVRKLEFIEGKIVQLPASKRAMVLTPFFSLCAEANNLINDIMDCMKSQFSKSQGKLNVCFGDLNCLASFFVHIVSI